MRKASIHKIFRKQLFKTGISDCQVYVNCLISYKCSWEKNKTQNFRGLPCRIKIKYNNIINESGSSLNHLHSQAKSLVNRKLKTCSKIFC